MRIVAALDRFIDRRGAVNILLVPQAVDQQCRHGERTAREDPVDCLALPIFVIGRMLSQADPERQLLHAHRLAVSPGRAVAQEGIVIVVTGGKPVLVGLLARGLAVDVADHLLPEGAVVEPVVALPYVDHRVDRHCGFERRVRIYEAHQRGETVVAGADGADAAVGLRHMLHQPVDGVESVGRMVDRRGVERSAQRPVHHIIALRLVLAADVLEGDDIARPHQLRRQHAKDVFGQRTEGAAGRLVGRIRRAIEHDRRSGGAFGNDQHGVQLHPVAHRDHCFAPDIEEVAALDVEALGDVAALGDGGNHALELGRNVAAGLDRGLHLGGKRRRKGDGRGQKQEFSEDRATPSGGR